jgi:hypothetical protein
MPANLANGAAAFDAHTDEQDQQGYNKLRFPAYDQATDRQKPRPRNYGQHNRQISLPMNLLQAHLF